MTASMTSTNWFRQSPTSGRLIRHHGLHFVPSDGSLTCSLQDFLLVLFRVKRKWWAAEKTKQTQTPKNNPNATVSYVCCGPQLLDDHLYPVDHLLPHGRFLWSRRHEVVEVYHLLVESVQEKRPQVTLSEAWSGCAAFWLSPVERF